jgi:hypothetical protein
MFGHSNITEHRVPGRTLGAYFAIVETSNPTNLVLMLDLSKARQIAGRQATSFATHFHLRLEARISPTAKGAGAIIPLTITWKTSNM